MHSDIHAAFQNFLLVFCLVGLFAICAVAFFAKVAPLWAIVWRKFLRLDGFGKVVCVVGFTMAALYGGSKGFWRPVQNGGADSVYNLVGIYTAVSNDVQVVGGQTVTNEIPMAAVMTLNGPVPESIEISVRESETNQWTVIEKVAPYFETEGTTNIFAFTTTEDYSGYRYWWAGTDKPAVVITSSGIEITGYRATSKAVWFSWKCEQPLAKVFQVQCKGERDRDWTTVATVEGYEATIDGFWIGQTHDWRIVSEYLEDGE